MEKYSVNNLNLIATGGTSYVYEIDNQQIIKVFKQNSTLDEIIQEQKLTTIINQLNIPSCQCGNIYETEKGYGLIYERVLSKNLSQRILAEPEHFDQFIKDYVKIVKKINSTECIDNSVPYLKDKDLNRLGKLKPFLNTSDYQTIYEIIDAIPRTNNLVHGDLHTRNIRFRNDDMLIIDFCDLTKGPSIMELAGIYRYTFLGSKIPFVDYSKRFTKIDKKSSKKVWHAFVKEYYNVDDKEVKNITKQVTYFSMLSALCGAAMLPEKEIKKSMLIIKLFIKFSIKPNKDQIIKLIKESK